MQERNETFRNFLERTDALAQKLGINVQELTDVLGIGRASLFCCRTGKRPITAKTWLKLEEAEREADKKARSDLRWEDTVQIEVDRQEAAETKRKDLSELLVKALEMAQEENTELRARVAELEGELAAVRKEE